MGIVLLVVGLVLAMKVGIGLFIYSRMKTDRPAQQLQSSDLTSSDTRQEEHLTS